MDIFKFRFNILDKEVKVPAIITHDADGSMHKGDLSTENTEMDCQPIIRIYDKDFESGNVTLSCHLGVARHME
jgi:hypothetical protein